MLFRSATGAFIGADELVRRTNSSSLCIVDVRNDVEWAGKDNTACCKRRGHIPRAAHIEWTKFLKNGRFKSPEEITALPEEHRVTPHGEIVVYCHRGARSANTVYALRSAGIHSARNFLGSWHEWSAHAELPIEV